MEYREHIDTPGKHQVVDIFHRIPCILFFKKGIWDFEMIVSDGEMKEANNFTILHHLHKYIVKARGHTGKMIAYAFFSLCRLYQPGILDDTVEVSSIASFKTIL